MIALRQTLIRTGALADEIGVHKTTICRWVNEDKRFRQCLFRRGWFSVQRLRDAGIIAAPLETAK